MVELYVFSGDDYIDSDDLFTLRDDANAERQEREDAAEEAENELEKEDLQREVDIWDNANKAMLKELETICDGLPTGEQCVSESKIDDHLEDMVADCYELPKNLPDFITLTIDYDMLKQDYTEFKYFDITYYVRAV
jgi:hypothetical protein